MSGEEFFFATQNSIVTIVIINFRFHQNAIYCFLILEDFTFENDPNIKLSIPEDGVAYDETFTEIMNDYVNNVINQLRQKYKDTKDYTYFRALRQALPMGYNYKFTWSANYAVLRNIYRQRKNHRLSEWHEFCRWIDGLPYAEDLITYGIK